jgi:hypothetical protein
MLFFVYPLSLFGQVKIMPLGDSITKGHTGSTTKWGYLQLLYTDLGGISGHTFIFDGFNNTSGGSLNYDHFEAYQGWQAIQHSTDGSYYQYDMLSHLRNDNRPNDAGYEESNTKLTNYNPELVLLHVGTNDLYSGGYTPSQVATNVDSVLNTIYSSTYNSSASSTVVFLAKIILNDSDDKGTNGPDATKTKNYNKDLVARAVNRIVNNSDRIIVVNMQDALMYPDSGATLPPDTGRVGSSDIYDDGSELLHPYQTGYNKMAGVWYRALNNYYQGIPTLIAPDDSANISFPDTLAWGIAANSVSSYMYQVSTDPNVTNNQIYNAQTSHRYFSLSDATKFVSNTKYYWRVGGSSDGTHFTNSDIWSFTTSPLYVNATIFLQGPYSSGTMSTALNSDGYLPLDDPYGQGEHVNSIPSPNIVDWVLVQLRSGSSETNASTATTVVAQKAVFLKKDGTVVDTDGTSPIKFGGISFGNYYIVVKHRNHLAVISKTAETLSNNLLTCNFTDTSKVYGGDSALVVLNDGKYGMIGGNSNGDNKVYVDDYNATGSKMFSQGYFSGDLNMNGTVYVDDYNLTGSNMFKTSKVP